MIGLAIGAGILGAYNTIQSNKAKSNAQRRRAANLESQAQRRLEKGEQEKKIIGEQAERDKTSYFADALSGNRSRSGSAVMNGLDTLTKRAVIESDIAMEDAQYEARMIREDAGEVRAKARDIDRSTPWQVGESVLSSGYSIYNAKK